MRKVDVLMNYIATLEPERAVIALKGAVALDPTLILDEHVTQWCAQHSELLMHIERGKVVLRTKENEQSR